MSAILGIITTVSRFPTESCVSTEKLLMLSIVAKEIYSERFSDEYEKDIKKAALSAN